MEDKIRAVSTIITAPGGINLAVVKVITSQGVTGHGCATFTQRESAVKTVVDDYLKPLVDRFSDPRRYLVKTLKSGTAILPTSSSSWPGF